MTFLNEPNIMPDLAISGKHKQSCYILLAVEQLFVPMRFTIILGHTSNHQQTIDCRAYIVSVKVPVSLKI